MKNEAEIIWWKTVKQDVETTPLGFTEAAAPVREGVDAMDDDGAFLSGCSLSAIIIYAIYWINGQINFFKFSLNDLSKRILIKFF